MNRSLNSFALEAEGRFRPELGSVPRALPDRKARPLYSQTGLFSISCAGSHSGSIAWTEVEVPSIQDRPLGGSYRAIRRRSSWSSAYMIQPRVNGSLFKHWISRFPSWHSELEARETLGGQ